MQTTGMKLTACQTASMSRRQIQSIAILQMNTAQLDRYLAQQLEENPVLDQEAASPDPFLQAVQELDRRGPPFSGVSGAAGRSGGRLTALDFAEAPDESASLTAFLRDQLERKHLPQWQLRLCLYIASLLDDRGYLLKEDLEALYAELPVPPQRIDRSVELLRTLEPAGVGARDLRECLLLQLERLEEPCETAKQLVSGYLGELAQKRFAALGKRLKKPVAEVARGAAQVRALDPMPGRAFLPPAPVPFVRPDLCILQSGSRLRVVVNDGEAGSLRLNRDYLALERQTEDSETAAYLRERIGQAKWLFTCLQQRRSTLEACACSMAELQQGFFLDRSRRLAPMTLADVAKRVGLHESTVCRALQDKYLLCRDGVFPLHFFFSNAVFAREAGAVSAVQVKDMVRQLIQGEDKAEPLSDQRIQELLDRAQGISISRRTVAKYRNALGIAPLNERRAV